MAHCFGSYFVEILHGVESAAVEVFHTAVSFAKKAGSAIISGVKSIGRGFYNFFSGFFSSKRRLGGTRGNSNYLPSPADSEEFLSSLSYFYGNLSLTECNVTRITSTMKTASSIFADISMWHINTTQIRLKKIPEVEFEVLFKDLNTTCGTGNYILCGNSLIKIMSHTMSQKEE